jgi:hypothetical protein
MEPWWPATQRKSSASSKWQMYAPTAARLRKELHVQRRTLTFRDATTDDADFILSLRINAEKSRYLSSVRGELSEQHAWLASYADSDHQAYCIIASQGEPVGTVHIYDPRRQLLLGPVHPERRPTVPRRNGISPDGVRLRPLPPRLRRRELLRAQG